MKTFFDKILSIIPYGTFAIFFGIILVFIYTGILTYERFIEITKIIIWPTIVLASLLFFRKVFTYLFFSMEEFNFFGVKGRLKDIREVIEEKVSDKMSEIEEQKEREAVIGQFASKLESTEKSEQNTKAQAEESQKLAREIFKMYKGLLEDHNSATKELDDFRREKKDRETRMDAMRERHRQHRLNLHEEDSELRNHRIDDRTHQRD